jgi:hypothetical protein
MCPRSDLFSPRLVLSLHPLPPSSYSSLESKETMVQAPETVLQSISHSPPSAQPFNNGVNGDGIQAIKQQHAQLAQQPQREAHMGQQSTSQSIAYTSCPSASTQRRVRTRYSRCDLRARRRRRKLPAAAVGLKGLAKLAEECWMSFSDCARLVRPRPRFKWRI